MRPWPSLGALTRTSSNPSPLTSPTFATVSPSTAPTWVVDEMRQAVGSDRPSSMTPSQSLSRPSHTSGFGDPGGSVLQVAVPSAAQATVPDAVQTPTPAWQKLPTPNPSSVRPLQSSSTPLQISTALGWIAGAESLQSAAGPVAQ